MDNDNKVNDTQIIVPKDKRHSEVLLFLADELQEIQEEASDKSYNLEEEYSKTKQNKSYFTKLLLLGICVVIVLLSLGLHTIISHQNEKIAVSLSEFADLNLKGLLDSVAKAQSKYDDSVKNLFTLETELESELKNAEDKKTSDIFLLDSLKIRSKREYNSRFADIEKEYDETVKNLHNQYDSQITIAKKEVEQYKSELDKFDTVKVEAAKEQNRALNSERQLRDLEQKALEDKYEKRISELEKTIENLRSSKQSAMHKYIEELTSKYEKELAALDPLIDDTKASKIVISTKYNYTDEESEKVSVEENAEDSEKTQMIEDSNAETSVSLAQLMQRPEFNINSFIEENSITDERVINALQEYQQFYEDYKYLDSMILELPHKNSIPEYINASRVLVNEMGEAIAASTADMYKEKEDMENQVEELKKNLDKQEKLLASEKKARAEENKKFEEEIEEYQLQMEDFETVLGITLISAKINIVIISAQSADNIKVYIAQKVRDSVTEEGIPAEIKAGKVTVKGRVYKRNENDYVFEPADEKTEFDISLVSLGSAVKTSLK